jgi:MFS family permease
VTYGVGMFFGSYMAGWIVDQYTYTRDGATLHTWLPIWIVPAAFSTAVLLLFAAFFRYREETPPRVTV